MPIENDISLEQAVMRTLTYFDLFRYPLKSSEVLNFLQTKAPADTVEQILNSLVNQKQIWKSDELYSLNSDPKIFERRRRGNSLAASLAPSIQKQANLIHKFPYVRSVMASGSFSKNYMDEKSDFDFFIICAPNRIWVSRMLLVLYKKLFLKNSHKYFCVNYFVDEQHLEIDERNIFTATELATVLPLTGSTQYHRFIASNKSWLMRTFPNFVEREWTPQVAEASFLKKVLEFAVTVLFGSQLNKFFKWLTLRNWKRKYSQYYSSPDFKIAFKSTDGVSKNHPRNFQKTIIEQYESRINSLAEKIEAA